MFETIEIRTQRGGHHNSFLQHTLVSLILSKLWKICASQPPTYLFSSYMTRWQIYSSILDTSKSVGHTSVYKMCRGPFHHGITHKSHRMLQLTKVLEAHKQLGPSMSKAAPCRIFFRLEAPPKYRSSGVQNGYYNRPHNVWNDKILQENCKLKNHIPERYESVWVNENPRSIVKICLDHNESGREPGRSTHTHT